MGVLAKGVHKISLNKSEKKGFFTRNLFTSHFCKKQCANEKNIVVLTATIDSYDCRSIEKIKDGRGREDQSY